MEQDLKETALKQEEDVDGALSTQDNNKVRARSLVKVFSDPADSGTLPIIFLLGVTEGEGGADV
ncbi:MAG: hypothetical protein GQ559_02005 [Desulfobulbaceae bacterium]|nr:hypothetical protein [Desulfobulbaceae bacterium]